MRLWDCWRCHPYNKNFMSIILKMIKAQFVSVENKNFFFTKFNEILFTKK